MAELRTTFDGAREVLAISARAPFFAVAAQEFHPALATLVALLTVAAKN